MASITSVEPVRAKHVQPAQGGLLRLQMPKFVADEVVGEVVYVVRWQTPQQGLPRGTVVTFEYLREGRALPESDGVSYPGPLKGACEARFPVEEAVYGANAVRAWRVTLYNNKKIIARKTSEGWR